jgi:phosphatidylserine decarboxylase
MSRLELTSMLESLGSTLSASTVDSFFASYEKHPTRDELTISEAVQCLEEELSRPEEERKRVDSADYRPPDTGFVTPTVLATPDGRGMGLALEKMSFAGPGNPADDGLGASIDLNSDSLLIAEDLLSTAEPSEAVLGDFPLSTRAEDARHQRRASADLSTFCAPSRRLLRQEGYSSGSEADYDTPVILTAGESAAVPPQQLTAPVFERVINVKNCPLCHRPRLSKKAEVDIITHLAICASQDWERVDRIMVGNFVTPSQAQRKWYTKLVGKVSRGAYQLGAVRVKQQTPSFQL